MSMLAEPRSKQKWSEDPRNTRWATDKSKYGYQMLTKMGWSEGKGLGQNENGRVSHIKLKKKKSNAGVGMSKSNDDDWISQQDDFNALLLSLNQGNQDTGQKKIASLEQRVKLSRKKILYTKFVKSKDLSNASSEDLASIFGQRSKSAPATPQLSDNEEEARQSDSSITSCPVSTEREKDTKEGFVTVHSGISIADYFAEKMAALKNKSNVIIKDTTIEKSLDVEESLKKKKKKKRKQVDNSDDDNDLGIVMKCKKKKLSDIDDSHNTEENTNKSSQKDASSLEDRTKKVKRKSTNKNDESKIKGSVETNIENNYIDETTKKISRKKKKKKKEKDE